MCFSISSPFLSSPRTVWIQQASVPAEDCVIILDAEIYRDRVQASGIIEDRRHAGRLTHHTSCPPTGLLQQASQLQSCRRLRSAIQSCGTDLAYPEFTGGHDPACWARELPTALDWLLKKQLPKSGGEGRAR